jgi:polyisoprenoid-binding protein YceI
MTMKKLNKQISAIPLMIAVIFLGIMPQSLRSQSIYRLSADKDATIKVLGSSNINNWTMTSLNAESQGDFKFDENDQLSALSSLSLFIDTKSLKSQLESMDDRTYKAMKADKYPNIIYKLSSAVVTSVEKNRYIVKTTGELTIAGVTQTVAMNLSVLVNTGNIISCTGAQKIKLSDYNIDPPSFMMGAMKVNNDLAIQFNLQYSKNNQFLTSLN